MTPAVSVVIPAHNEAAFLPATIGALVEAVERSGFETEIVLVDDGSTDGSADIARKAVAGRLPLQVVTQRNRGRFVARREGLGKATGEWVLLLDSRVILAPEGLSFVAERLEHEEDVWNAHVHVAAGRNPFGVFWKLMAELAWEEYFAHPRTTSFDASNFDRFPKGTTCFLARRELLREAVDDFRSRYADIRQANDDTPLIRWIAERHKIHISPRFSCVYAPRTRFSAFVRHSFHRGVVFFDGHGRRQSRFYPVVVAFYPASVVVGLAALRRPALAPAMIAASGIAAGAFAAARRRTPFEIASLTLLTPVYALGHGAGMWRGLGLIVRDRLRKL